MVAHTCNPSTWGGLDSRIAGAQEFGTSLGNIGRHFLYHKHTQTHTHTHTQMKKVAGCGDA